MSQHPTSLRMRLGGWVIVLLMLVQCLPCRAQTRSSDAGQAPTVSSMEVEGNHLLDERLILSYVTVAEGKPFGEEQMAADVAKLRELGLFTHVAFRTVEEPDNRVRLVLEVVEAIQLDRIDFEGNAAVKDSKLASACGLAQGSVVERYSLAEAESALTDIYRGKGYLLAKVKGRIKLTEGNEKLLTFHIQEGMKCWVETIAFHGRKQVRRKELTAQLRSKKRGWPGFLFPGKFDESLFREDVRSVQNYYRRQGFLNAEVGGYHEFGPDLRGITLNFVIYEGNQFQVTGISFEGNTLFRDDELLDEVSLKVGEPLTPGKLKESLGRLSDLYARQGHVDVGTGDNLREQLIFEESEVQVKFMIVEGDPVFIRRIRFEGLTKTRDLVARRSLTIRPGERANVDKLKESRRRLINTGFFDLAVREPVRIELEPDSGTWRDAVVKVQEGATGRLELGGAVGTASGLFGQFSITENNFDITNWPSSWRDVSAGNAFRGGGQRLALSITGGVWRTGYVLSFYEPALRGTPYSFGTRLYSQGWSGRGRDKYDESRTGANVSVGKEIGRDTRVELELGYESVDIDDVDADAAFDIRREEGSHGKTYVEFSRTTDRRDNWFAPTEGHFSRLVLQLATGDVKTYRFIVEAAKYWPIIGSSEETRHVLSARAKAGIVNSYSGRVPFFERLYAGGIDSLRGFDFRGVSPSDPATGDLVGGQSLLVLSTEYTVPIYRDMFRGAVFLDAGYVEEKAGDVLSGWDVLRTSAGVGMRLLIPAMGNVQLRLDLAFPLMTEKDDETRSFHFSLGAARSF